MDCRLSTVGSREFRPLGITPWLLIIAALLAFGSSASSQEIEALGRPIEFPLRNAIRGSELVLKPPATVLIGEIHGTWETPLLVASLVRSAQVERKPTILCVEIPASEQVSLHEFVRSGGGEDAVAALQSRPHWANPDGRASAGMFGMLELIRRLNRDGGDIRVIAMDITLAFAPRDPNSITPQELARFKEQFKERDRVMAGAVLAARREFPKSNIVVLAGNIHASLTKGLPGDVQYAPMGWRLSQALPDLKSLQVQFSAGDAWVATEQGIGPTKMKGVDRGNDPFIELSPQPQDGYHGVLYVAKISAAPPVRKQAH